MDASPSPRGFGSLSATHCDFLTKGHPYLTQKLCQIVATDKSVTRAAGVDRRIYFRVFDRAWIDANMPDAEKRHQKAAFKRGFRRASAVAAVIRWLRVPTPHVLQHLCCYSFYQKIFLPFSKSNQEVNAIKLRTTD